MDFTFLHAADLHLDSPLRGLEADAPADRIRGATRQALVNLVDLALAEKVAFVLLAGDLYDGDWQDYPTGHFLVSQLARLTQAGIHVYAISGNHDAQSVLTRQLPWPERARMFDTTAAHSLAVPDLDVVIHGQGFATQAVTDNLAANYPAAVAGKFNIGLLHTAVGDDSLYGNYAPCTVQQLADHGYQYWALGHIHLRGELHGDPSWIVFPGNLQGRHINEEGEKGATLVHVRAGRVTPEHRTLDVVRWARVRVDLSDADGLDALGAEVRAALREAAVAAGGAPAGRPGRAGRRHCAARRPDAGPGRYAGAGARRGRRARHGRAAVAGEGGDRHPAPPSTWRSGAPAPTRRPRCSARSRRSRRRR